MKMERRCIIPTFQRDYEWTKEDQWKLLYEDLESAAQRLAKARSNDKLTGLVTPIDQISPHFLGAIVLDYHKVQAGGLDHRAVIDGQQRLTTLHLIARALFDVAIETGSKQARSLRRLLEIPDDVADGADEIHKLWPRRRDRDEWRAVMSNEVPDDGHRYTAARRFFADSVRKTLADEEIDGVPTFGDLVDAFQSLFRIVVIELDPNVGRGHAQRRHADRMLAAWLTAQSKETAHPDRLYGMVRRHLDAPGVKAVDLLPVIERYAEYYCEVRGEVEISDKRLARLYRTVGSLAQDTTLALLLWLRDNLSDHPDQLRGAVAGVESYLVRRAMIGFSTRGYNMVFQATLEDARSAPTSGIAEAVEASLAVREGAVKWPTDDEIADTFIGRKFYDNVSRGKIRIILGGIDHQLQAENVKAETVDHDYDALTIEHLMPQTWQINWPVSGEDAAARELAAWADRRADLVHHSSLRLNAEIGANPNWNDWDEDAIAQRGSELARIAARRWPRPPHKSAGHL